MKTNGGHTFFYKMKFIKISMIVFFAFIALLMLGSCASADTVYVDDDYSYGSTNDGHLFGIDAFATIQDGVDGGVQGLLIPTSSVDMVVAHWGPSSYFRTTLSGIGGGYSVWDGIWIGHCVDEYHYITPGTHYPVTLYSTYDPTMPWPDPDWPCVNFLLNHKDPTATKDQVQKAIWYFINGGYTGSDPVILGMIGDAEENGVNFVPSEGEIVAVLCDAGTGIQKTFIEVTVPESNMECGTVLVSEGMYEESVTVMKSLKILGSPGATIRPPRVAEDVYLEEAPTRLYEYAVALLGGTYDTGTDMVTGSDTITVELSGFTINANEYVPVQRWASILCRNVNTDQCDGEASVHDNTLINIDVNGHETFGIICYGDMDILIEANTVDQFARGGIGVMDGTCEILSNTVIGPGVGVPVTWAPNGIQVGYGAMGTIQGNDVSGCGWPGTEWAGTGIMIVDTSDVVCDGNDVHDNEVGIGVTDFPEELYGSAWAGVVSDITVTNNRVEGNEWGLDIANDASDITVTYNEFIDQINDAIDVYDYSIYASYTGPAPTNVDITCNKITGSGGDGLWVGDMVTDTVDATCNWWGDCSGPSGDGPGYGDTVVGAGNVDFEPWVGFIIVNAGGSYYDDNCDHAYTVTFDASGCILPGCCDESVTYEWDFDDGTGIHTTSNPIFVHSFESFGYYTATLTVTTVTLGETCTSTGDIADVYIYGVEADAGGPYELHEDYYAVNFDGTGSVGFDGLTYEWDFGDGQTGTGPTPTHTYTMPGSYEVELKVTESGNGCWDIDTAMVHVIGADPPIIDLSYPEGGEILSGTVTVTWFAIDNDYPQGEGLPIYLYYRSINDDTWIQIGGIHSNNVDMDRGCYNWDIGDIATGKYILKAEAVDKQNNIAFDDSELFTIDNQYTGLQISGVQILDTSTGSTQWVKNGDTVVITAEIIGGSALQREDITADLSSFGLGTIVAENYDGTIATWNLYDVQCTPSNGPIIVRVTAEEHHSSTGIITADNTKPTLSIEKPGFGLYFFNSKLLPLQKTIIIGAIEIEIDTTDTSGIQKAEFYLDNYLENTVTNEPFEWYWSSRTKGQHQIQVKVYDSAGNIATQTVDFVKLF